MNVAHCHLFLHCTLVSLFLCLNSWPNLKYCQRHLPSNKDCTDTCFECICVDNWICNSLPSRWAAIFIYAPIPVSVAGCRHSDKWQCSRSGQLPSGVRIRAGCFYSCHSAPGLRSRSDPDLSPAPSRKLPTNPPRDRWDWEQGIRLAACQCCQPHLSTRSEYSYSMRCRMLSCIRSNAISPFVFQNAAKSA